MSHFFNPGFGIRPSTTTLGFEYGTDVFGPPCELRKLETIRRSLRNPKCQGPDPVYAISMDVGTIDRRLDLLSRNLLFGAVTYAAGRLGEEPVRSQGHRHAVSPSCGRSTPELYEIWSGKAVILMQESGDDIPGRCFAVEAGPGETVLVPPDWLHATISADPGTALTFGAWCVRDFGFDYTAVRARGGLAWFPRLTLAELQWDENPNYSSIPPLIRKRPGDYKAFGIRPGIPIWTQYIENPDTFMWIPRPQLADHHWKSFTP